MGSPLVPLLANWFVASKKLIILISNSKQKPIFYARYTDDIFVIMKNNNDLITSFRY